MLWHVQVVIIVIIITKALIKVTQSQLYNCYWGTVQTHCHWSGKDCRKSVWVCAGTLCMFMKRVQMVAWNMLLWWLNINCKCVICVILCACFLVAESQLKAYFHFWMQLGKLLLKALFHLSVFLVNVNPYMKNKWAVFQLYSIHSFTFYRIILVLLIITSGHKSG